MKLRPQQSRTTLQLNLPLLNIPTSVIPEEKRTELVLALVELLVEAAQPPIEQSREGGADEHETHR